MRCGKNIIQVGWGSRHNQLRANLHFGLPCNLLDGINIHQHRGMQCQEMPRAHLYNSHLTRWAMHTSENSRHGSLPSGVCNQKLLASSKVLLPRFTWCLKDVFACPSAKIQAWKQSQQVDLRRHTHAMSRSCGKKAQLWLSMLQLVAAGKLTSLWMCRNCPSGALSLWTSLG